MKRAAIAVGRAVTALAYGLFGLVFAGFTWNIYIQIPLAIAVFMGFLVLTVWAFNKAESLTAASLRDDRTPVLIRPMLKAGILATFIASFTALVFFVGLPPGVLHIVMAVLALCFTAATCFARRHRSVTLGKTHKPARRMSWLQAFAKTLEEAIELTSGIVSLLFGFIGVNIAGAAVGGALDGGFSGGGGSSGGGGASGSW